MPIKVSFILPCYNVAPYIGRCLESIEHQDIPQEEYEVICVDDCSPDNTGDVIREYQQRYPNIVYHRHETNKTAGGARNTGIEAARGEYLWFVDPDDGIVCNVLAGLYAKAKELNTDVLFFNKNYINEKGESRQDIQFADLNEVIPGQQFFMKYCPNKRLAEVTSVWREIYNRDFCILNGLRYPEIRSSQDVVFAWKAFLLAQRVSAISDVCYNHFRRPNSTTGSRGRLKAESAISASLLYPNELLNLIETLHFDNEVFPNDLRFGIHCALNDDSRKVFLMDRAERKRFYRIMKEKRVVIDRLCSEMNRKTRLIFEYKMPLLFWLMVIDVLYLK